MMEIVEKELPEDGYPDLRDIVPLIPDNDWCWWVLEVEALGLADSVIEELFGECASSQPVRPGITWPDVVRLAAAIRQSIDMLLVATRSEEDYVKEELDRDDFSRCLVMFRIFDSGEASLGVSDDLAGGKEILESFLALWDKR
ncbi:MULTISPECIES: hypothetical protein [unclassified Amycolatopsis]|uniref:hypothetical protein n=1 Tax=unclassified Amycolatopsis TaxID=2618356 RepID=UPI0005C1E0BA|nr:MULTISPECIES: hypothetical protein [unclassified Amycolatopsis]